MKEDKNWCSVWTSAEAYDSMNVVILTDGEHGWRERLGADLKMGFRAAAAVLIAETTRNLPALCDWECVFEYLRYGARSSIWVSIEDSTSHCSTLDFWEVDL